MIEGRLFLFGIDKIAKLKGKNMTKEIAKVEGSSERERAKWYDFSKVCEEIKNMILTTSEKITGGWQSSRIKYVEIRVDIRNGKCSIKDRHGEVISIEELQKLFENSKTR